MAPQYGTSPSAVIKSGRVMGYGVQYDRNVDHGACCIFNEVVQWSSARAAERGFAMKFALDRSAYPHADVATSPSGDVGVVAFVCACNGRAEDVWIFHTYKGNYDVSLEVHAVHHTASSGRMLDMAIHELHTVLSRIPASGHRVTPQIPAAQPSQQT